MSGEGSRSSSRSPEASSSRSSSPAGDDRPFQPSTELLHAYNGLLARSLGPVASSPVPAQPQNTNLAETAPPLAPASKRPAHAPGSDSDDDPDAGSTAAAGPRTKAERLNAKKKRKREREREEKRARERAAGEVLAREREGRPVQFRLFSSAPIKGWVVVAQEEEYAVPENPLHQPLAPATSSRIRRLASEAAVEPSALTDPSGLSMPTCVRLSRRARRVDSFTLDHPPEPGPHRHGERHEGTAHARPPWFIADFNPSSGLPTSGNIPHDVSLLHLTPDPPPPPARRRKRHGSRVAVPDHPDAPSRPASLPRKGPRYWRPPRKLGGKSAGYAYGY